ncbi:uncharacterized protein [Argopecten irradians]|uniref:uncharacterized protein n=1 Tax=Argopecten irradians TaxID=31199 RepID=UPI0037122C9F
MYELAQRKFLRQIASYASNQDIGNYPRLFVADIFQKKATENEEGSKKELDYDSVKNKGFMVDVYTMCEYEQGWHSVCDPIEMRMRFSAEQIEEYASYLARITMVMQHNPNFSLSLFNTREGQDYLKMTQELALKNTNDFQTSYHNFRQLVFDLDTKKEKGKLLRCRMPSGKTFWLCEKHSKEFKATVLSDKVTEVKHKVTNQPWLEAMTECLRMEVKFPFKFRSMPKAKRLMKDLKVDDVERDSMRRTLSHSVSNLGKGAQMAALNEAIKALNEEEEKQPKESAVKKSTRSKKSVGFAAELAKSMEDLNEQSTPSQHSGDSQSERQEKGENQEKEENEKEDEKKSNYIEKEPTPSKKNDASKPVPTPEDKDSIPTPTPEDKEIKPSPEAKQNNVTPTDNNTTPTSPRNTKPNLTTTPPQRKPGGKTQPTKPQGKGQQGQSKPAEQSKACVLL